MLIRTLLLAFSFLAAAATVCHADQPTEKYRILFNGENLDGWSGDESLWSVAQGAIVGETTAEKPIQGNTFLVWQGGEVADFEFHCKVRFEGNNSGVQYRSATVNGNPHVLQGYQADLHKNQDYFGMMYGEKYGKRGIIALRGQKLLIDSNGSKQELAKLPKTEKLVDNEWNDLRIIAVGNRLVHQVNGITTIDLTDNDPSARASGQLGLQLHQGPAMKVEFRNLLLRTLTPEQGKGLLESVSKSQSKAPAIKPALEPTTSWLSTPPKASWIWAKQASGDQKLFMRKNFQVKSKLKSARLYGTCDNQLKLFINGTSVGSSSDWNQPIEQEVSKILKTGKNIIAAECQNAGGAAGFVFKLKMELEDGSTLNVVSDKSWRMTDQETENWQSVDFDDSSWDSKQLKELGQFGVDPWKIPKHDDLASNNPDSLNPKNIIAQPGFVVDLVHRVSADDEGSWVCLTNDSEGGLYASDQAGKGLFHVTLDQTGVRVEKLDVRDPESGDLLSGAQGLLWAFDSLWMHRNGGHLYRITDANDDGTLDTAESYPSQTGGGEHGNHALVLSEDGEGIYMVGGNHAPRQPTDVTRVQSWDEDFLLTRMWDPRGHARGLLAPGGWVTRLDLKTKQQELFCVGFRNQYDVALNRFGDMFTFDADMEWDLGSPWYRPTRICQVVSGGDYGWRSGSGKWASYYEDSLPASVDIGPGSPTGVVFGTGASFPTRYQDALFALDWTFGTIYAVHLQADGAGYVGDKEPFVYGSPLPVTDAVFGSDGHLYFTVGGRGAESALYRVRYVGDESTLPPTGDAGAEGRAQRKMLEAFHGRSESSAVATAWPFLNSQDRFLRSAARVAIESQNPSEWASRVFAETDPQTLITSSVALARTGSSEHLSPLLKQLLSLDAKQLPEDQLLGLLRAYQLAFIRMDKPSESERDALLKSFDSLFPNESSSVNRELVQLLVYLRSPSVVAKTMQLINEGSEPSLPDWQELASRNSRYGGTVSQMLENPPPVQEMYFAFALRNVDFGWTSELRRDYFDFLNRAGKASGGASYPGYLTNIRSEALATATSEDRMALEDITGEDFNPVPDFEITPLQGTENKWTFDEALAAANGKPDFESGRSLFFAADCGKCHRLAGLGGGVGPDLTSIPSKFDQRYVIEAMVYPSKNISDQYGSTNVLLDDGTIVTGIVVDKEDTIEVYPIQATDKPIVVEKDQIELMQPSKVSQMPEGLLDRLSKKEIRDLTGYLMSGGNRNDRRYK